MSWKIIEKYRRILAAEEGAIIKEWGGKLTICLVYPNRYRAGMSNLGFQAVYSMLNSNQDVVCERAFLPDPADLAEYRSSRTSLLSLESQRPIADFDLIAFSISFETDYLNVPLILSMSNIPAFSAERGSNYPLIIAGGAALFLNPEPVADFFDLISVGEAEVILPELMGLLRSETASDRAEFLVEAARHKGLYAPSLYEIEYNGLAISAVRPIGDAPRSVVRAWTDDLDSASTGSRIFTDGTEFSGIHLVEISRGCPRGCRFCAAGFIYEPYRQRSYESVKMQIVSALEKHQRIGLVGAAVGDFQRIGELCRSIRAEGGKVTVSSLRVDALDEDMIQVLAESGHKTVSLAPEGGSQRLRDLIKKGITAEDILKACCRLITHDILNLKLYFIIGLPTETLVDMEEMVGLVEDIRQLMTETAKGNNRLGKITLSINPFIPKPFTPFQWCGMAPLNELEDKASYLRKAFSRMPNVEIQIEGLKEAVLQALLSRGDRRLAPFLVKASAAGGWKKAAKELGLNIEELVCRTISLEETLAWDIIYSESRERLEKEFRRAIFT